MSKAIVDLKELESFARELKEFNRLVGEQSGRLRGRFRQLGDSWRDQEYQKFAQEFEQTMRTFYRFQQVSEQYVAWLQRKAVPIRDYLNE